MTQSEEQSSRAETPEFQSEFARQVEKEVADRERRRSNFVENQNEAAGSDSAVVVPPELADWSGIQNLSERTPAQQERPRYRQEENPKSKSWELKWEEINRRHLRLLEAHGESANRRELESIIRATEEGHADKSVQCSATPQLPGTNVRAAESGVAQRSVQYAASAQFLSSNDQTEEPQLASESVQYPAPPQNTETTNNGSLPFTIGGRAEAPKEKIPEAPEAASATDFWAKHATPDRTRVVTPKEAVKATSGDDFWAEFEAREFAPNQTRPELPEEAEDAHSFSLQQQLNQARLVSVSSDSEAEEVTRPARRANNMNYLTTEKLGKSLRENVATIIKPQNNRSAFLRFIAEADGVYNHFKAAFSKEPRLEQQLVQLLLAKFEWGAADTVAMSMPASYPEFKHAMIKAESWVRHLSVIENEGRTTKQIVGETPIGYISRLEVLRNEFASALNMDSSLTPAIRRFMGTSFEKAMVDHAIRSFDDRFLRHTLSRDKTITILQLLRKAVQEELDRNIDDTENLYSDPRRGRTFRIETEEIPKAREETVSLTTLAEIMKKLSTASKAAVENPPPSTDMSQHVLFPDQNQTMIMNVDPRGLRPEQNPGYLQTPSVRTPLMGGVDIKLSAKM